MINPSVVFDCAGQKSEVTITKNIGFAKMPPEPFTAPYENLYQLPCERPNSIAVKINLTPSYLGGILQDYSDEWESLTWDLGKN